MSYDNDQSEYPVPTGPEDAANRKSAQLLPRYFRTNANKKFLSSTIDQLTQPGVAEKLSGYIGRKTAKAYQASDNYIGDVSTQRENYQLEPSVVLKDDLENIKFYKDYNDYLNQIAAFGGNTRLASDLNAAEYYAWNPNIDWDKFVNYREYFWLPTGPTSVDVFGKSREVQSTYTVTLEDQVDNTAIKFSPPGLTPNPTLELYRGQTYRFEIDTEGHPIAFATSRTLNNDGKITTIYNDGQTKIQELEDDLTIEAEYIDNGYIEFEVPLNAPDTLYYVSSTDPSNVSGVLRVSNIVDNTEINVEDILGKKTYTTEGGFDLSNGMKINFVGTVTPVKYAESEWYVEGVGSKIKLIDQRDLVVPSTYAEDLPVPFDTNEFDSLPFANANSYAGTKDYVTINRASTDRNAWSRYNRWFHRSVIEKTNQINGLERAIDQDARAKRPIIEFDAGLKLYNFGTSAKVDVDLVDTFTTDVFSTIEGSSGYNIDGVDLSEGMRILFLADPDIFVKNKIYTVSFITHNNSRQIALQEAEDGQPTFNENVLVKQGTKNSGKIYFYNDTTWKLAQEKLDVNQNPLFELFDVNGNSFGDLDVYPESTFRGNSIFTYKVGTGTNDTELGFPLKYRSLENSGDIEFDFNLLNEITEYQIDDVTQTITSDIATCRRYTDISTYDNCNGWSKAEFKTKQSVVRQYTATETQVNNFAIDVYARPALLDHIWLRVFVNNAIKREGVDYQRVVGNNDDIKIQFNNDLNVDDIVIIKTRATAEKTGNGHFEFPYNLERNPLNENISSFTLGEVNDHVNTMVEEIPNFAGEYPGSSNLRDLGNVNGYGKKFLQHAGPLPLALYHITNKNANVVKSIEYATREYSKFKRAFLQTAFTLGFDGPVKTHVDLILTELNKEKNNKMPFYFSDMLSYRAAKVTTYEVEDPANVFFALTNTFNLDTLSATSVNVYQNGTQLIYKKEYTFNSEGFCVITAPKTTGDIIELYEYETSDGSYVPPTPTKLGLYPKFVPEIYIDDTYQTPTKVIQGHDGSITVAYDDYRDDLLLEFEKRIFNNIKQDYNDKIFDISELVKGEYRSTGVSTQDINNVIISDFLKWLSNVGSPDYTTNSHYNGSNSFTFNYSFSGSPNETENLGSWRGVYKYAYDTDRPHSHPWEMLGITIKPDWWEDVYGPAPYTRDNLVLWQDLEAGFLKEPGVPVKTIKNRKRPGLTAHIPVDDKGRLLSPLESSYARGFISSTGSNTYKFGDQAPTEAAWRRSSEFPFSLIKALVLNRPALTLGVGFDISRIKRNNIGQLVYTDTEKVTQLSQLRFPNTYAGTTRTSTSGIVNYIANYLATDVTTSYDTYVEDVKNIKIQLGAKLGGFTDKSKFNLILDSRSPFSQGNVFVPKENYDIILNTSSVTSNPSYTGIIVEKLESGYAVRGYDKDRAVLTYNKPVNSSADKAITVGGVTESYLIWTPGQAYIKGQIVEFENNYYRVVTPHTASASLDEEKFKILPSLPITGGATATLPKVFETASSTMPYGTVLETAQEVVNILLGYQHVLEKAGFVFETYNENAKTVEDFQLAAKEFLFWTTQNWKSGSLLTLSPLANNLIFESEFSRVDSILDNFYGYNLIKADGTKINQEFIDIARENNRFELRLKNTADGIYALKLPLVQTEHVVVLDNVTVFNDVIYDLAPGYRQERIKVVGYRSDNWNGSLNIPGFIYDEAYVTSWQPYKEYLVGDLVKYKEFYYSANKQSLGTATFITKDWERLDNKPESQMLTNAEYKTNQFADFYDLDSDNFDTEQQRLAQHLIGYQKRQYLQNIINDDVSQYKFYQGFIQDKGTQNALDKLFDALSSADKESLDFYEEWAIKKGQYGAADNFDEVEYLLDEEKFRLSPQPVELVESLPIDNTDFIYRIRPFETYVKSKNYDHKPFPTKVLDREFIKTAGYVDPDDVSAAILVPNAITQLNIDDVLNGYVWIARQNTGWNVYKDITLGYTITEVAQTTDGTNTLELTTDKPIGDDVNIGDTIGILDITPLKGFHVVQAKTKNIIRITKPLQFAENLQNTSGIIIGLLSTRVQNIAELNEYAEAHLESNSLVWVDDAGNGNWKVFKNNKAYDLGTSIPSPQTVEDSTLDNYGSTISANERNTILAIGAPDYYSSGAIDEVEILSQTDINRTTGVYNNVSATGGTGNNALFNVTIAAGTKEVTVTVANGGLSYNSGDILTISYSDIGESGNDLELAVITNKGGVVNVYNRGNDSGELRLIQTLEPDVNYFNDVTLPTRFGAAVAVSPDGKYLAVGSPNASNVLTRYKGTFQTSVDYSKNEIVQYNEGLWKARKQVLGQTPNLLFSSFDSYAFFAANSDSTDIKLLLTGNHGLAQTTVDHLLIRAPQDMYLGTAPGDVIYLKWNNYSTSNLSLDDTQPFGGAFAPITGAFLTGSHTIQKKIDHVFNVENYTVLPEVGDIVSTDSASGKVEYIQTQDAIRAVIYISETNGIFATEGNLFVNRDVLIAAYTETYANTTPELGGYWLINTPSSYTTTTSAVGLYTDTGRGLVYQDVENALDPDGDIAYYYNIQDNIQNITPSNLNDEISFLTHLSFSEVSDTTTLKQSPWWIVRTPKVLSDQLTAGDTFDFYADSLGDINIEPSGLSFEDINKNNTIVDEWDGYIDMQFTEFKTYLAVEDPEYGKPIQPTPKFEFDSSGNLIQRQFGTTVKDLTTGATAEVVFYQRKFNNVRLYVKNVTGDWLAGKDYGEVSAIQRVGDVYDEVAVGSPNRTMGEVLAVSLGTSEVGKLFLVSNGIVPATSGVPAAPASLTVTGSLDNTFDATTSTLAFNPAIIGKEYWFYEERESILGIPRLPSYPDSENNEWQQLYNLPADNLGTDSGLTNEGLVSVYEKLPLGEYNLINHFVMPNRQTNGHLGSSLRFTKNENLYTLFVVEEGEDNVPEGNYGRIHIIKHGSDGTNEFEWEIAKDRDYRGLFAENSDYAENELAVYNDVLYRALTSIASGGAFNPVNWTAVEDSISRLGYIPSNEALTLQNETIFNPPANGAGSGIVKFVKEFDTSNNGAVLAVSTELKGDDSTANASVVIYRLLDGHYQYSQEITAPADNTGFGSSVSISADGTRLAIGETLNSTKKKHQGVVHIYKQVNGEFVLNQTLTSHGNEALEQFGYKVSFDGEQLAVTSLQGDAKIPTTFDNNTTYFDGRITTTVQTIENGGVVYIYEKIDDLYVYSENLYYNDDGSIYFGENLLVNRNHVYVSMPRVKEEGYQGVVVDFRKDNNQTAWKTHKESRPVVDINKMRGAFLYNTKQNVILDYIDIIDPIQGKIAGTADAEIDYKVYYDPALYNVIDSEEQTQNTDVWADRYVGKIWWNLDEARFYNPYQNDTIFQTNYWNTVFAGTKIGIYEWVESSLLPSEWDSLSGTPEGEIRGITGTSRYSDRFYVSKKKYDSVAQRFTNKYYYWVENKTTVPPVVGRSLSGSNIASLIENPAQAGYKFVALNSENKFILYNCNELMKDKDIAINFRFYTIDNQEQNIHNEYQILTEGLGTSKPQKDIEQKWFDSLIGYDEYDRPVPDDKLGLKQRYGTLYKPRQSWFVNRVEALKQAIERINSVLKTVVAVDVADLSNLNKKDPAPTINSNRFDVQVDTYSEIQFIGTAKATTAQLELIIDDGVITDVTIINAGRGYQAVPTYIIRGEGENAQIQLTIDSVGKISSASVVKGGKGYLPTTQIEVRPFTALVVADETAAGRWTLNTFDSATREWSRSETQKYDVSRYWEYINWYADGYGEFTNIKDRVDATYQLSGLQNQIGDIVKVTTIGSGGWLLLEKIANVDTDDYTINYRTIGKENGTIQFLRTIYDATANKTGFDTTSFDTRYYDIQPITETRIILETIRDKIFTEELSDEYNNLFFASVRYVFSEQSYVDWAFKTSFIKAQHNVGSLEQKVTFKNDNLENYQEYVNEVKPYKTKVREYVSSYDKIEPTNTTTTDFDLPPTYNEQSNRIETESVKSGDGTLLSLSEDLQAFPKKYWLDNVGYSITKVNIGNPGTLFTQKPVISFVGGGGSGAKAEAFIGDGKITRIDVLETGSGYITAPQVVINGSQEDGATEAKASVVLGQSKVRSTHVRVKFDRVSGNFYIVDLEESQTFTGTGANTAFTLKWPLDLKSTKTVITVDDIESLKSEYNVSNTLDTTKNHDRYLGKIEFTEPPKLGSTIVVSYNRNIDLLDAQDRINFFYNPTSGMIGKDVAQLMDGIDYGGVEVKSLEFEAPAAWDTGPWFTGPWDTYDVTFEDEVFRPDSSTTTLLLSKPLETDIVYNVYKNGVRIDDPNYGTLTPVTNPNAIVQSITGAGQTELDLSDSGLNIPVDDDDVIIIRKTTSDGSFLPDPISYDTQLSGGNLSYSTAAGIDAESINIDGDGFVTPTTSKGPEELIPGQIVDTLDMKVYQRVNDGAGQIYSQSYVTDGNTDTYDLGIKPHINDAVFVRIDKVAIDSSLYTLNYNDNTLTFATVPAIDQELHITTIGQSGQTILDINSFVADGTTIVYETNIPWSDTVTVVLTANGVTLDAIVKESNGYVAFDFTVAPQNGLIIDYSIFYGQGTTNYSQVKKDTFVSDGSTLTFELSQAPFNQIPPSHKVVVSANNKILNAGYNQKYTIPENSQREYSLQLFQQPNVSLLPEQITVFLNGVKLEQTVGYRFDIFNSSIVLFSGIGSPGDTVEVFVVDDGEYIFDGTTITFDTSVSIPEGTKVEVTSFSNHDLLDINRISYDNVNRTLLTVGSTEYTEYHNMTTGLIKLRSPAIDAQYVWVIVNGTQLTPSVDYFVTDNRNSIKINQKLNENDVIELIHFAADPIVEKFGWRQFKDMLNRTHFKRLNDKNKFELAQDLNWFDLRIEVTNGDNLTVPSKEKGLPGVLFIEGERIEYFIKEGNTLRQIRRGTLGTGVKEIYTAGTKIIDQSASQTIPYKDEIVTTIFTSDGTTGSFELDFVPSSTDEFEVFAAGRRLRKNSVQSFDDTIDQDSPEADVTLEPEFSVTNNVLNLNFIPGENQKVIVVRKAGKLWADQGVSLSNSENDIARFLRDATVDLPE